jgi:hypothetical protein
MAVGSGNQILWRSTFLYSTFFPPCYWQNFYPFGAVAYPFGKFLEILTNEFNHKGTSPIRLAHPLVRMNNNHHSFTLHSSTSSVELRDSHFKSQQRALPRREDDKNDRDDIKTIEISKNRPISRPHNFMKNEDVRILKTVLNPF